jgi:hypothetical protein
VSAPDPIVVTEQKEFDMPIDSIGPKVHPRPVDQPAGSGSAATRPSALESRGGAVPVGGLDEFQLRSPFGPGAAPVDLAPGGAPALPGHGGTERLSEAQLDAKFAEMFGQTGKTQGPAQQSPAAPMPPFSSPASPLPSVPAVPVGGLDQFQTRAPGSSDSVEVAPGGAPSLPGHGGTRQLTEAELDARAAEFFGKPD